MLFRSEGLLAALRTRILSVFELPDAAKVAVDVRIAAAEALGRGGDPRLPGDNFLEVPGTGKRVEARIPPGVDIGSRVHLPLEATIDVNLLVQVQPHQRFRRTGNDLHVTTRVPVEDLVLGGEAMVPTIKSTVALRIPPGTQAGQVFRLGGRGMPHLGNPTVLGDLYATVEALLPQHLSDEERKAFELLRKRRETK